MLHHHPGIGRRHSYLNPAFRPQNYQYLINYTTCLLGNDFVEIIVYYALFNHRFDRLNHRVRANSIGQ